RALTYLSRGPAAPALHPLSLHDALPIYLQHQPVVDHADDIVLVLRGELNTLRNVVPFRQTAATAGGGRVLGNRHRMAARGGLFSVVDWVRGGKTLRNKVGSMLVNGIGTFVPAVLSFFCA